MEIIVLSGFVFALLGCILFDLNILIALGIGFCLFFGYGLFRKFSFREMTRQLCEKLEPDSQKMAIDLEDAPVVISPMIPWSIAGAVPIATIGAPALCLLSACFLYFVPIWHLLWDSFSEYKQKRA